MKIGSERLGRKTGVAGALAAAALLLVSCGSGGLGSSDDGPDAPTNVQIRSGDQHVTLSWDAQPGINYWIFCATDPSITLDNWTTLPNPKSRIDATSPQMVVDLINGRNYSCIVNGRRDTDKGGPGSPAVTASTRPGGAEWATDTPWTSGNVNGVAFGGNYMVAVGDAGGLWYTRDNVTWTPVALTSNNLNAVIYANGRFVAVGDNGTVLTSTDGQSWGADSPRTTANLYAVQRLGASYIAVGANGTVIYNGDGSSWDVRDIGTTQTLLGVAANNDTGQMVIVGANGSIFRSPDTITWTAVASPVNTELRSAAYGNGTYAIVGAGGVQLVSNDAQNWSVQPALTTNTLNAVTFHANTVSNVTYSNRFVAVGDNGTAMYSDDGRLWTLTPGGTSATLRGVGFGLSRYKAVGTGGVTTVSY